MKKYVRLVRDGGSSFPHTQAVVKEAGKFHKCDPQGAYTGIPAQKGEKPVQDADDL